jgi:hypothetical protein
MYVNMEWSNKVDVHSNKINSQSYILETRVGSWVLAGDYYNMKYGKQRCISLM